MKTKTKRFIIVDDDNKPMTWQEPQLVYANRKGRYNRLLLETYTEQEAGEFIEKSQLFTKRNKNSTWINYFLIPVKP